MIKKIIVIKDREINSTDIKDNSKRKISKPKKGKEKENKTKL